MIYADYAYYSGKFGGSAVSENDFPVLALKASEYMDAVTFDRLKDGIPENFAENISRCCCELVENIQKFGGLQTTGNGAVSSEKIGSYSVDYQSTAEQISTFSALYRLSDDVVRRYLGRSGLLYRGTY